MAEFACGGNGRLSDTSVIPDRGLPAWLLLVPSLGRFTQADPSGREAHPYAYSLSSPINFSDPSGLSALSFSEIASLIIDVIALGADALSADTQRELGLAIAAFGVGYIVGGVCTGLLVGSIATGPGVGFALAGCGIVSEAVSLLVQQA